MGDWGECILNKFAHGQKLGGVVDTHHMVVLIFRASRQTGEIDGGQPHEIQQGICKVPHLVRKNLVHQYRLEDNHLESNWQKKTWVSWSIRSGIWSSNEPLVQRQSTASLTALERALPAHPGRWYFPTTGHWRDTSLALCPAQCKRHVGVLECVQ